MTPETELDHAHAAMEAAPENDALRLRFYERLADSELFILLTKEPVGETISPEVFEVEDQSFILVFDRPERLAGFVGKPAPYAALSGRGLAEMVQGQAIGFALNLEVAPSAMLMPAEAVMWLAGTLANMPQEAEARIAEVMAPRGLPETLITGLDRKLATAGGLARFAYLVGVEYDTGAKGHMLAFVDAVDAARSALATAVGEALTFSGIEAGALDVGFFAASDAMAASLARVGLRFDLPTPEEATIPGANPGMDPARPPKLR